MAFKVGDRVRTLPVKCNSDLANSVYAGRTGVITDINYDCLQGICYHVKYDEELSFQGYPIAGHYYFEYENGLELLSD